uniref:uncharacterized protein n=1 Tax=Semicossyphus pulcher TaxID=241346 RepID=UPI0037E94C0A
MTSPKFVFYLTCLVLGQIAQTTASKLSSSVRQLRRKTGENLTLQCVYNGDGVPRLYWYKQSLGQELKLISALYKYENNESFHDEFKNNPRFSLDTENGKNYLTISDLQSSDSATYNCISCSFNTLDILETIIVDIKGSGLNVPVLIQQPGSETIQDHEDKTDCSLVLVYLLSGALIFMTILVVVLAFFMNKMNKRNSFLSQEASSSRNIEDHRDADNLFYAALSINRPNTSRRQRNDTTKNECVYSSVK